MGLRGVVVWLVAGGANSQAILPTGCTLNVVGALNNIVSVANNLAQAAVDCTLPGLDELSCSSDLTAAIQDTCDMSANVALATTTCGGIDNLCTTVIFNIVSSCSSVAHNLIAAAGDCTYDPFICTFDVVSAVDAVNGAMLNIAAALPACNQAIPDPLPVNGNSFSDRIVAMEVNTNLFFTGDSSRRLNSQDPSEQTANISDMILASGEASSWPEGNTSLPKRLKVANYDEAHQLHMDVIAELTKAKELIEARMAAATVTEV